jgi:ABC-2 type transport system permease protein
MKQAWLIARRELWAYLRSPLGYVIISAMLVIDGVLFNAYALGEGRKLSGEVLEAFFYFCSGTTMVAAVLLSFRLIAEERQTGSMVLLSTSPVPEPYIVLGKWLSAWLFLALKNVLTLYMPLLILVNGKVSWAHLAVGYAGLLLLGAAAAAIGLFASSLTKSQVMAVVLAAVMLVVLLLLWMITKETDPPFRTVLPYLALHNKHFQPFQRGVLNTRDVVYYASVVLLFLVATSRVMEARRWR